MRVATRFISVRRNKITSHRTLILFEVAKLSVNDWLNKIDKQVDRGSTVKKKSKSASMPYFQIRSKLGDSVVKREIDLANFEFCFGRAAGCTSGPPL